WLSKRWHQVIWRKCTKVLSCRLEGLGIMVKKEEAKKIKKKKPPVGWPKSEKSSPTLIDPGQMATTRNCRPCSKKVAPWKKSPKNSADKKAPSTPDWSSSVWWRMITIKKNKS